MALAEFIRIENDRAGELLVAWGHSLGACNRPFGVQSFALFAYGEPVSVAVSASTVNASCGGYARQSVVELARLCSKPDESWATRVCLRLWREIAPVQWKYWNVTACVSYSDSTLHSGQIYRFDGWRKVADVKGGTAGGGWNRRKTYNPKAVWAFDLVG